MQINLSDKEKPLSLSQGIKAATDILRQSWMPTDYVELVKNRHYAGRVAFKADGKTISYFRD